MIKNSFVMHDVCHFVRHISLVSGNFLEKSNFRKNAEVALSPLLKPHLQIIFSLDVMTASEDYHNFDGKRALISFLSWLDFCDQLIEMAHATVGEGLARAISQDFLQAVLQPAILQP